MNIVCFYVTEDRVHCAKLCFHFNESHITKFVCNVFDQMNEEGWLKTSRWRRIGMEKKKNHERKKEHFFKEILKEKRTSKKFVFQNSDELLLYFWAKKEEKTSIEYSNLFITFLQN